MDTVSNLAPARPKTKPTGRHPSNALSTAFLRSAPPGRHADGNGLYLFVQPSGTRSWIQRLVIRGRRRELGLGSVALVPLAEAREKALVNRKLAREGGDPLADKRRAEGIPTFAQAASRVLVQKRDGWRGRRHHRERLVVILPKAIKPHCVGVAAGPPTQRLDHPPDRPAEGDTSRETPLHGWRTDHIVPTPRVSSSLSAPSPDGGGRDASSVARSALRTNPQEAEPTA